MSGKEERFDSVEEFLESLKLLEERDRITQKLKNSLLQYKESLKKSVTDEKVKKNKGIVVELLGKLAIIHAETREKAELLNCLEDLKFYTVENREELVSTIDRLKYMIKENIDLSKQFVDVIKNIVHRIKRES